MTIKQMQARIKELNILDCDADDDRYFIERRGVEQELYNIAHDVAYYPIWVMLMCL
jgi:hypothetical protein